MKFKEWLINEADACGQCFVWAGKQALKNDVDVYHGLVTEHMANPPKQYEHAWIEKNGRYWDWQMVEMGYGGKFHDVGYPPEIFEELYQPQNVKKYNPTEVSANLVKYKHWGPWE